MAKRNGQTITLDKKIYINKYAAVGPLPSNATVYAFGAHCT